MKVFSSPCFSYLSVKQFNNFLKNIFLDGTPELVVEFKGHKEKVNELAWSPHKNLMLLSCSNDFTAKVCSILVYFLFIFLSCCN